MTLGLYISRSFVDCNLFQMGCFVASCLLRRVSAEAACTMDNSRRSFSCCMDYASLLTDYNPTTVHQDMRSPQNTNRMSYLASQSELPASCSDDRNVPSSCFGTVWLRPYRQLNWEVVAITRIRWVLSFNQQAVFFGKYLAGVGTINQKKLRLLIRF